MAFIFYQQLQNSLSGQPLTKSGKPRTKSGKPPAILYLTHLLKLLGYIFIILFIFYPKNKKEKQMFFKMEMHKRTKHSNTIQFKNGFKKEYQIYCLSFRFFCSLSQTFISLIKVGSVFFFPFQFYSSKHNYNFSVMSSLEDVKAKLQELKQKFIKGHQILSQIKLGWFNNNTDKSNLHSAKHLAVRGHEACVLLLAKFNDIMIKLSQEELNTINTALKMGRPFTMSKSKVGLFVALIIECAGVLANILQLAEIPFLYLTMGSSILGLVGVTFYEGMKASKNKDLIAEYLRIEHDVLVLERAVNQLSA